jgi:hypothetical protein
MKIRELLDTIDFISEDIPSSTQQASLTPVGSTTAPIPPNGGLGVTNASQVTAQSANTSTSSISASTSTQAQPTSTQQTSNPTMGSQTLDPDKLQDTFKKIADLSKNNPDLANILKNSGL